MTHEINLGTFCIQGRYFSATMSMQDDEGNAIAFDSTLQTDNKLKLYRAAIEKMLKAHESNSTLKTPESINDDGVKYAEDAEIQKHANEALEGEWDTLFAAQSDHIRFAKIKSQVDVIQGIFSKIDKVSFDPLDRLVWRYREGGMVYNYRNRKSRLESLL